MVLLDLLGRRWALRLIWELRVEPLPFRSLQERMGGVSSSVLAERLRELRAAGVVESTPEGYALTARGSELLVAFAPLQRWADDWSDRTGG
jgi:DNA-binding HxlR family transcriptional regulator